MRRAQLALATVLLVATAVFTAGVIAERSEGAEPAGAHQESAEHAGESEEVVGVDAESTPLVVLAIATGLGLAAVAATRLGRVPAVLLAIALIALAWAALDLREFVHQLDEARAGIAAAAIVAAGLHLTAVVLGVGLVARERDPTRRR